MEDAFGAAEGDVEEAMRETVEVDCAAEIVELTAVVEESDNRIVVHGEF